MNVIIRPIELNRAEQNKTDDGHQDTILYILYTLCIKDRELEGQQSDDNYIQPTITFVSCIYEIFV